ncbi:MAG TPA: NAD-dependent epimerase/dehydratase family protein [Vicinamibacteria bacterium]|nr:NAD-dependent epimerase/dehydratase family protein [Vicinamibacteria bacterium]
MRVLVTGGAGFIGSNAVARFGALGHAVSALDNFSRVGATANAGWLKETHGVEVLRVNVADAAAVNAAVARLDPEVVLHCAGQVAVTTSVTDPRRDFEDNALGTLNVLEAVRLHAPRAIVLYTSTTKVYGGLEDLRVERQGERWAWPDLKEGCPEDRPIDFHSPYGCSKGAADQYVRDYARIYGLRTVVFRQSCIYGYRQFGVEDQGWVAWFTIRSVKQGPVTIFGDGYQVRDVLFIDDLLDAYVAAVARIDAASGNIYNLGGGPENALSLRELVHKLDRLNDHPLKVAFADWRPGDQRVFVADIRKAHRDLGWVPQVGVDEGLRRLHLWVSQTPMVVDAAAAPPTEVGARPGS